jgi:sulfonate transport system substrate-binding protein
MELTLTAESPTPRVVRVCGVPEHYNLPITQALAADSFSSVGASVTWTPVPGGTGAMASMLRAGDADIALGLTEGVVAAVLGNAPNNVALRYAGGFVTSPLRWMIATGSSRSDLPSLASVASRGGPIRVSVSRLGSGSHLMAYLLALREGWPIPSLEFIVHRDFRAMRKGAAAAVATRFLEASARITPIPHPLSSHFKPSPKAKPIFLCGNGL